MDNNSSGGSKVLINMLVFMGFLAIIAGFALVKPELPSQLADQSFQQAQADLQYQHEQAMAALNPEVVAVEARKDEINSSYAAIVAVAASADVSQTKIAQAIPSSLWAVAIIIIGVVVLMLLLFSKGKRNENSSVGSWVDKDEWAHK